MTWTFYNALGQEKRATVYEFVKSYGRYDWNGSSATVVNQWNSVTGGTWTRTLESDAAQFDGAGTFTCRVAGVYDIELQAAFSPNATGVRGVGMRKNGSLFGVAQIVAAHATATNSGAALAVGFVTLAVGDTVDLQVYLNGAAPNCTQLQFNIALVTGSARGPRGSKWWISGQTVGIGDPEDVPFPAAGDVFLYPDSADTFTYDGATWTYTGPMQVNAGITSQLSGAFPTTPPEGTAVEIQDNYMRAQGVRWRCVYDSLNDRWNVVGGAPLHINSDTLFTTAVTHTTYQDTGISIDVPAPGTYDITTEAWLQTTAVGAGNAALVSWAPQGGVGSDAYAAAIFTNAAALMSGTATQTYRAALSAAQYNVRQVLRSGATGAGAVTAQRKHLWLAPVFLDP